MLTKLAEESGSKVNRPFIRHELTSLSRFKVQLETTSIVSFDFFDTLVTRHYCFSPKDLFLKVQKQLKGANLSIPNFTALRIQSENNARNRAWGLGQEDVTLSEIYNELQKIVRFPQEMVPFCIDTELSCERDCLTVLESGHLLFKTALDHGKKVVITSDTYFDYDFIQEIAERCGYGAAASIYLSSVYRCTKSDGSLFKIVSDTLQCAPSEILHVGDNRHSDVAMALNNGFKTFLATNKKQQFKWRNQLGDVPSNSEFASALLCEISDRPSLRLDCPQDHSPASSELERGREDGKAEHSAVAHTIAVENVALVYFGYASWLLEQVQTQKIKRVYFAARDGLIIKRVFDLLIAGKGYNIDSRYLYVSRAALYPSLIFTDPDTARRQFCQNWDHLTIEAALKRISLTFDESSELLAQHHLDKPGLALDGFTEENFNAFLRDAWPLLKEKK